MSFPRTRPRRLRATPAWRALVAETTLSAADLIYPLFVVPGKGSAIRSAACRRLPALGRRAGQGVRDRLGARRAGGDPVRHPRAQGRRRAREAYDDDGIVPRAIRGAQGGVPDLLV